MARRASGCTRRRCLTILRFHALGAAALFSESQARALVAVPPRSVERALRLAKEAGVPVHEAGEVGGEELSVEFDGGRLRVEVAALAREWTAALPRALGR